MDNSTSTPINDYANSMFRFEEFNNAWIDSCADYVKFLFGTSVNGKTIVDYAFGRGNWSLAFLRAGAAKVIAIDASIDNVTRFKNYCDENEIFQIKVIQGNILDKKLRFECDLFWLYGIMHHIKEFDFFLSNVKSCMKSKDSLIYIYHYNKNCLRERIVENCRGLHTYKDEKEFIKDNFLFLRSAKGRASDDLVAPYISWKTAMELQNDLRRNGLYVHRQDIDFQEYSTGIANTDFYPHQFLCSQNSGREVMAVDRMQPNQLELDILSTLLDKILPAYKSRAEKKNISIGLFNTYFAHLNNAGKMEDSLIEIFLYLMRLLLQTKVFRNVVFQNQIENYYQLLSKSMSDKPRENEAGILGSNLFTDYLLKNRIRL